MGTFFLLWALVLPITLIVFGAKETGQKISNLPRREGKLSPWFTYEGWQNELLHTNDPDNKVNVGRQTLEGFWEVQLYNKRLNVRAYNSSKDRDSLRIWAQRKFNKWESLKALDMLDYDEERFDKGS